MEFTQSPASPSIRSDKLTCSVFIATFSPVLMDLAISTAPEKPAEVGAYALGFRV